MEDELERKPSSAKSLVLPQSHALTQMSQSRQDQVRSTQLSNAVSMIKDGPLDFNALYEQRARERAAAAAVARRSRLESGVYTNTSSRHKQEYQNESEDADSEVESEQSDTDAEAEEHRGRGRAENYRQQGLKARSPAVSSVAKSDVRVDAASGVSEDRGVFAGKDEKDAKVWPAIKTWASTRVCELVMMLVLIVAAAWGLCSLLEMQRLRNITDDRSAPVRRPTFDVVRSSIPPA